MSIAYECRFNIILDLSTRPDLIKWLSDPSEETLPESLRRFDRVEWLGNDFTDDLKTIIDTSDISNVIMNVCIGNKSKDDDIDGLIYELARYITSGEIYLYNDDVTGKVEYGNIPRSDMPLEPDAFEYTNYPKKKEVMGYHESDEGYDPYYERLFVGLLPDSE